MRTLDEIKHSLKRALEEHGSIVEWHDKASKKYEEDKRYWGKDQADYGEVDYSKGELEKIVRTIAVLKWVIDESE